MKKYIAIILFVCLILLQYRLWFASGGVVDSARATKQITKQKELNYNLEQRNNILIAEVKKLKHDNTLMIEEGNKTLGMIPRKSIFYQI